MESGITQLVASPCTKCWSSWS